MLTIPVLKLLIQIKTRGSAEKLPRKDLHSLLCLQLLGCRQEGKLFLLQHNSGEWKISPSWSLCKRPCDGQGGSLWTKKLSSGTGTTGGTSTETTGDIQSWDLQDWRQEKPATSTFTQMMFQGWGEGFLPLLWLFSGTLLELNTAWEQQTRGRTRPLGSLHVEYRHSGKYSFIWVKKLTQKICVILNHCEEANGRQGCWLWVRPDEQAH